MKLVLFGATGLYMSCAFGAQALSILSLSDTSKIDLDNYRKVIISGACSTSASIKLHLTDSRGVTAPTIVASCSNGKFSATADTVSLKDGAIRIRATQVVSSASQYSIVNVTKDISAPTIIEPRSEAVISTNYSSVLVRGRCAPSSQVRVDVSGINDARLASLYIPCESSQYQTQIDLSALGDGNVRFKASLKSDLTKYAYVDAVKEIGSLKISPSQSRFAKALSGSAALMSVQAKNFAEARALVAAAVPGTRVILPSGKFSDIKAPFIGQGEENLPIIIEGAADGSTILTGKVALRISGSYVLLRNITIENPLSDLKGALVDVESCKLCGVNNLKISGGPDANLDAKGNDLNSFRYILIRNTSKKIEVFGNSFIGKKNAGSIVLIERSPVWSGVPDGHRIFNNLFSGRVLKGYSANDFDSIRIGGGDSCHAPTAAQADAYLEQYGSLTGSIIEFNIFENGNLNPKDLATCNAGTASACSAESEIISIKAPQNIIRFNTFRNNYGGLTIRQGYQDIVEGNYFSGDNRPAGITAVNKFSYGIRITGDSHLVVHNHLENLSTNNKTSGGIALLAGQENAGEAGYWQVENSIIAFNHIQKVATKPLVLAADYLGTPSSAAPTPKILLPLNNLISNNSFFIQGEALFSDSKDIGYFSKLILKNNIISDSSASFSKKYAQGLAIQSPLIKAWGFSKPTNAELVGNNGLLRASSTRHSELLSDVSLLVGQKESQRLTNLMKLLRIKHGVLYDRSAPLAPSDVGASY